jgi:CheY-like chemotaxis protein
MFTINANENCPNNLNGDDYKLSKVLNIFLTNAVNYTNYGEVSINISSKQIDNDNHEFTFHIKNTGHAMKTENFERSFEDLIKLNTNSNNDIDADTLKIIVAKELLNKLNGTVEFINETGQGTQYIVKLTQKVTSPGELGNIREKIQTVHEETYQKVDLQGKKVLIVDDGKVNSIVLERLLKPYNLEIKTTSNPRDGVDKVTYEDYDMIFVNDQMEDMTGEEFINKLQSTGNRLPPIVGMILNIDILDKTHKYDNILYCPIEYRELTKIIKNNKWD